MDYVNYAFWKKACEEKADFYIQMSDRYCSHLKIKTDHLILKLSFKQLTVLKLVQDWTYSGIHAAQKTVSRNCDLSVLLAVCSSTSL